PRNRHIINAEGYGGHQSRRGAPAIKQRQDTHASIDRAAGVRPTGMEASACKHAVAVSCEFLKANAIPRPAVYLNCLPPVVERLAIGAPCLHTSSATTHQGNMQQPCTSWLDQAHVGIEQHRNAWHRPFEWLECVGREQELRHPVSPT